MLLLESRTNHFLVELRAFLASRTIITVVVVLKNFQINAEFMSNGLGSVEWILNNVNVPAVFSRVSKANILQ